MSLTESAVRERTLEEIYRNNYGPLLGYIQKLTLGDRGRAEDIVQDTMMRAWQHIDEIDMTHATAARPWLFTVARRITIDTLRARAVRPAEVHSEMLALSQDTRDDIEHATNVLEIRSILGLLPESHRQVLTHLYLHERTTEETAQIMNIPAGTVKSRAFYALRAVRRLMDQSTAQSTDAKCQTSKS